MKVVIVFSSNTPFFYTVAFVLNHTHQLFDERISDLSPSKGNPCLASSPPATAPNLPRLKHLELAKINLVSSLDLYHRPPSLVPTFSMMMPKSRTHFKLVVMNF